MRSHPDQLGDLSRQYASFQKDEMLGFNIKTRRSCRAQGYSMDSSDVDDWVKANGVDQDIQPRDLQLTADDVEDVNVQSSVTTGEGHIPISSVKKRRYLVPIGYLSRAHILGVHTDDLAWNFGDISLMHWHNLGTKVVVLS